MLWLQISLQPVLPTSLLTPATMDSYGAGDARCLQFQRGLGYPYSGYSSSDRYSGGGPGPYPGQLPG